MSQENYWKLQSTIKNLKDEDNRCFVCGCKKEIVAHHIKKVSQESKEYYSRNNVVLLCDDCHHIYHQQYSEVNQKTFSEFVKKNLNKQPQRKKLTKRRFAIKEELKISKLKKIFKELNKTRNKVLKISVNGVLYDISKISSEGKLTIIEINK